MQNSDVEGTIFPANFSIVAGDKLIDLSTPLVMGIVNVTPDSFYSGSRSESVNEILTRVNDMLNSGASILDIGGYSSRPDATDISVKEEISRIQPAIAAISKEFPDAILSIDTFKSEVAKIAIEEGAQIINDISGFGIDPKIADVAGQYQVPYILMHMRGTPQNMQKNVEYDNLFSDISNYFSEKIKILESKGVKDIILDPGFGFSKTIDQNYELLDNLEHFRFLERPILVGLSRKSMIYKKLGITAEESLNGTIALNKIALSKGAKVLRVHDAKEATELIVR
ncbi:MAG: dihydropteroate synthase [Crocinitomicaceae bacterium]|nr:dihydropteroate synthase [Crocinitomicaceae bacterium]